MTALIDLSSKFGIPKRHARNVQDVLNDVSVCAAGIKSNIDCLGREHIAIAGFAPACIFAVILPFIFLPV